MRAPELRGRGWLNTGGEDLTLADLRGRFVLLDFWAFCCINCLHVLDELRPVEEKYDGELVVVGVHSPKFVHEAAVHRGLEALLVHGLTPDPRTGALVALLHALRSTHKVVDPKEHDLKRRELDRRAKEIAEGSWGSTAVREAMDAMLAAVMVAVTASTSAGSG